MKITSDKQCEHAKAGEGARRDHPVEGVPGLALRVTRDGHKSWSLLYYRQADNRRRRLTLGRDGQVFVRRRQAAGHRRRAPASRRS